MQTITERHAAGCKQTYGCHFQILHNFLIKVDILFALFELVKQKIWINKIFKIVRREFSRERNWTRPAMECKRPPGLELVIDWLQRLGSDQHTAKSSVDVQGWAQIILNARTQEFASIKHKQKGCNCLSGIRTLAGWIVQQGTRQLDCHQYRIRTRMT